MIFPFGINVAGFFPLFSALLILASWFFSYMANRINEICFKRMNEIEITLGIKGHRHIYYRTKRAWYYRAQRVIWFCLFLVTIVACILGSIALFTRDQMLGHKNISNTLVYTQLVDFGEEEYVTKVAWTLEEACKLVEAI